jgi:hypothetical protein
MGFVQYFIESNVPFGGVSWAMLFVWALALGFGIYLLRNYRDNNPIRLRFVKQVGLAATVLSALGLVLLVLKLFNVPVLEWRLWGWLVALASIGYAAWAAYMYNTRLPAQIATTRSPRTVRRTTSGGAKTYAATGTPTPPRPPREPRPVATTTRREARRDKKRKTR